jgi:hypothetical protein
MLFERLAIDVMLNMDLTNAARLVGLSWDEAHHIRERAVARGLSRRSEAPPPCVRKRCRTIWAHTAPGSRNAEGGDESMLILCPTTTRLSFEPSSSAS